MEEEKKEYVVNHEIHSEHKSLNNHFSKDKITKIKEKTKIWLKDPYNLAFVGVMLLAIGIRLYYFWLTKDQPFWWDEACYGSLAKNFITDAWRNNGLILHESLIRPLFLPLIWAFLMLLHLPESASRFILEVLPSIISVLFVYLVSKEVFNKKIALISTLVYSLIWVQLFYSVRFLADIPAVFFLFGSIYFFIKCRKEEFNIKYFSLSLIFLSLSTMIKFQIGIIFFVYLLVLILERNLFLNKAKFWYSGLLGLSPLIIFFLLNYFSFGNIFPALFGGSYLTTSTYLKTPIAWNLLGFAKILLETPFFIFFILGFLIVLSKMAISFNLVLKDKKLMNYLLLTLVMVAFFSFFIFYMRAAEDRYFIPAAISLASFSGFGIFLVYDYARKYSKLFAVLFIILVLTLGGYYQLVHTDEIIIAKKDSYLQIKQGAEWFKENVQKNSLIVGTGIDPYFIYYADLPVSYYNETEKDKNKNADYLVIHAFPPESYLNTYASQNQDIWDPIAGFFFDKAKQQPGLIIFKNKNIYN
jgi:4-amino-4-deoxy-L-arabinose transferase-like glycosyltransferase